MVDVTHFWPVSVAGLSVAGIFASCASAVSAAQIYYHVAHYDDPVIQKYYIRIAFLVPNYALCSLFSLVFQDAALYVETMRDMYEAFVIYSFMSLLLEYVGGPGSVEAICRDQTIHGSIVYGTCCFPPMQVDGQFVKLCKRLVLQFVLLKPIIVALTLALYSKGLYVVGDWSFRSWYFYLQLLYNFCYGAALLGLIHFWTGTKDLLRPYKPLWKFVAVKSVVFITFWQGFFISLFLMHRPTSHSQALQTWLLCIEMLPAAVMMWFAFPASPYLHAARSREQGGIMLAVQNVGNAVTIADVVMDLRHQFKPQYNTYTRYDEMDVEDRCPAPTGSFRHATYIIKDPFQEQVIAEARAQNGRGGQPMDLEAAMECYK